MKKLVFFILITVAAITAYGLEEFHGPLRNIKTQDWVASRMAYINDINDVNSVTDLTAWVAGTAQQVYVTDDTDGTLTLNLPQDINTVSSPTFANLSLGTGELTTGSINRATGTLTIEVGGTAEISVTSAAITFGGNLIGPDDFYMGSASDTDSVQIETSGDVIFSQDVNIVGDVNIGGSVTYAGLTASRLTATDASKALTSVADLTSWIGGTTNQITSTSDGDGTITLSLPKYVNLTGADPELRLTDTGDNEYGRITRSDTDAVLAMYNRVAEPGGTGALDFDGVTGTYVEVTDSLHDMDNLSISVWVNIDAWNDNTTRTIVVTSGFNTEGYLTFYKNNTNRIFFTVHDTAGAGSTLRQVYSASASGLSGWHHIVVRLSKTTPITSTHLMDVHIDGSNAGMTYTNADTAWTAAADTNFRIGGHVSGGQDVMAGLIDEVAIWSEVISTNDIADLYDSGSGLYPDKGDSWPTDGGSMGTNLFGLWHCDDGAGDTATDDSDNGIDGALNPGSGTPAWVNGKVQAPASDVEVQIIKSQDGTASFEEGILTISDPDGRTVIQGQTIKWNIGSTQKGDIDASGNVTWVGNLDAALLTSASGLVIADAGNMGSATTTGAITIDSAGQIGIGPAGVTPGTLVQLAADGDAYLTLQNLTNEHTDGGAETKIIFEDHSNTALAQIQASHDGSADDSRGDLIFSTHGASALAEVLRFNSDKVGSFSGNIRGHTGGWEIGTPTTHDAIIIDDDGSVTAIGALFTDTLEVDSDADILGTLFADSITITDGNNIGSVSDPDALSIAAGGDITITQDVNIAGEMNIGGTPEAAWGGMPLYVDGVNDHNTLFLIENDSSHACRLAVQNDSDKVWMVGMGGSTGDTNWLAENFIIHESTVHYALQIAPGGAAKFYGALTIGQSAGDLTLTSGDIILADDKSIKVSDGSPSITLDNGNQVEIAGYLGIDTTAPLAKLDVNDNGVAQTVIRALQDDDNTFGLVIGNASADLLPYRGLRMRSYANDYGMIEVYQDGAYRDLVLAPSGGNTGIGGTVSPATDLHVVGTTRLGDQATNYAGIDGDGDISFTGTARIDWTKITANGATIRNSHGTTGSTVSDLQTAHDGNVYTLSEEAAETPGMDVEIDFTGVTAFNWVQILARYEQATTAHGITVMLEITPFDGSAWHRYDYFSDQVADLTNEEHSFFVPNDAAYINSGVVKVRFVHEMAGTSVNHDLVIDVCALYQ